MEADCVYFHSENICEQFLVNGKCEVSKRCIDRHPKECKFWLSDPKGCLRGDICKYLHRTENKGTKVKDPERTSNNSEASRFKTTPAKKTGNDNTRDKQNREKENNVGDIVVDMEEEISSKYDIILQLRTKSDTLESKNEVLKEELDRLKRVAINMRKELKAKQG